MPRRREPLRIVAVHQPDERRVLAVLLRLLDQAMARAGEAAAGRVGEREIRTQAERPSLEQTTQG
jgi:hypothetical protein